MAKHNSCLTPSRQISSPSILCAPRAVLDKTSVLTCSGHLNSHAAPALQGDNRRHPRVLGGRHPHHTAPSAGYV